MYTKWYENNELKVMIQNVEMRHGVDIYTSYDIVDDSLRVMMRKNDAVLNGRISAREINMAPISPVEHLQGFLEEMAVKMMRKEGQHELFRG